MLHRMIPCLGEGVVNGGLRRFAGSGHVTGCILSPGLRALHTQPPQASPQSSGLFVVVNTAATQPRQSATPRHSPPISAVVAAREATAGSAVGRGRTDNSRSLVPPAAATRAFLRALRAGDEQCERLLAASAVGSSPVPARYEARRNARAAVRAVRMLQALNDGEGLRRLLAAVTAAGHSPPPLRLCPVGRQHVYCRAARALAAVEGPAARLPLLAAEAAALFSPLAPSTARLVRSEGSLSADTKRPRLLPTVAAGRRHHRREADHLMRAVAACDALAPGAGAALLGAPVPPPGILSAVLFAHACRAALGAVPAAAILHCLHADMALAGAAPPVEGYASVRAAWLRRAFQRPFMRAVSAATNGLVVPTAIAHDAHCLFASTNAVRPCADALVDRHLRGAIAALARAGDAQAVLNVALAVAAAGSGTLVVPPWAECPRTTQTVVSAACAVLLRWVQPSSVSGPAATVPIFEQAAIGHHLTHRAGYRSPAAFALTLAAAENRAVFPHVNSDAAAVLIAAALEGGTGLAHARRRVGPARQAELQRAALMTTSASGAGPDTAKSVFVGLSKVLQQDGRQSGGGREVRDAFDTFIRGGAAQRDRLAGRGRWPIRAEEDPDACAPPTTGQDRCRTLLCFAASLTKDTEVSTALSVLARHPMTPTAMRHGCERLAQCEGRPGIAMLS